MSKLISAEEDVAIVEKDLTDLQAILVATQKEVSELMVVIQRDKKVFLNSIIYFLDSITFLPLTLSKRAYRCKSMDTKKLL